MGLSNDLISQFVKVTNTDEKPKNKTSTVYGTVTQVGDQIYVQFDGSNTATPVSNTVKVEEGDRVVVTIKNHAATITGNIKNISASSTDVDGAMSAASGAMSTAANASAKVDEKIAEFQVAIADRITTDQLNAAKVDISKTLTAQDAVIRDELIASIATVQQTLTAKDAEITGKLDANSAEITSLKTNKLSVEEASATYATIKNLSATDTKVNNLQATHADFVNATAQNFQAANASIHELSTNKLDAETANANYANIDFSNIGKAAIEKFFSKSGMITNLTVGEGTITGELVGVTISGDLIKGNTVKADKLVVKGSDGIYYKLNIEAGATTSATVTASDLQNGLHGTAIIAKTITAEKISVSDLVAFGADIAGFHINNQNQFYSGAKSSVSNTTQGIYMDATGQFNIGDGNNYIKYFKDTDGLYKLDISMMQNVATKKDIDAINSKFEHDQLIVNGGGELGDNTNFSSWEFDGVNTHNSAGSFTRTDKKYVCISTDERFLVNPQKEYTLKIDAKTKNKQARLYAFLNFLDVDGNTINCTHNMYVKGSLTTLARDLKDGDTKVYLTDLSGWTTTAKGGSYIIVWGYTNSYGYTYPEETYSRTYAELPSTTNHILDSNYVDFTNNVITLSKPWDKGSIPAGTKASQGGIDATYKYLIEYVVPDPNWTEYSGKISGTDYSGTNASRKFPPGTAYCTVGFLWNIDKADDQLWITNVGLRDTTEITDTQNALDSIRTNIQVNHDSITSTVSSIQTSFANTAARVDNLEINNRNLLTNSEGEFKGTWRFLNTGLDLTPIFEKYGLVRYTISLDIKTSDPITADRIRVYCQNGSGTYYDMGQLIGSQVLDATSEWQRLSFSFIPYRSTYTADTHSMLSLYALDDANDKPCARRIKIELGGKATDWFPAPEDTLETIDGFNNIGSTNIVPVNKIASDRGVTSTDKFELIGAWGTRFINETEVSEIFEPDTEYTIRYDAKLIAKTDVPTAVQMYVGFLLYGDGASDSEINLRTLDLGETAEIGDKVSFQKTFKTPASMSSTYRMLAYSRRWSTDGSAPYGHDSVEITNFKIVKGPKITSDWSPAVEDMATAEDVEDVKAIAEGASDKADYAISLITQLSGSISMLVADGEGTSLMTQTEEGWTFSTADIQDSINKISDDLNTLTEGVGSTDNAVAILQQAVEDLGEIADYVTITSYENEPCIELGEADSEFKLRITNTRMMFTEGSTILAYFTNQAFNSKKVVVEEELQQGGFVWKVRSNGNLGLTWKGGNS